MLGTSLAVQWLGLHASIAEVLGSSPGWGTKIPQAARCGQKKKKVLMLSSDLLVYTFIYLHMWFP